jgi:hypothetical protein
LLLTEAASGLFTSPILKPAPGHRSCWPGWRRRLADLASQHRVGTDFPEEKNWMQGLVSRLRRSLLALSTAGVLAAGMAVAGAPPVAAEYGNSAVYQVEISGNLTGSSGYGVWLWIALNADGSGDYAGSDCGHSPGGGGAAPVLGDATWTMSGDTLIINGVSLLGGQVPVVITVPSAYGHYRYDTISAVFHTPFLPFIPGWTIVQVAP